MSASKKGFNHSLSVAINRELEIIGSRKVTAETANLNSINAQLAMLKKLMDMGMRSNDINESPQEVAIEVVTQGQPVVNNGHIVKSCNGLLAIEVDLRSKYCEVGGSLSYEDMTPGVIIETNDKSLYLKYDVQQELTELRFPDFSGYEVFSSSLFRYTLNMCLIKR